MKKHITAIFCAILAICVIVCLTACSGGDTSATESARATVDEAPKMSYEVAVGREEKYDYDDEFGNHYALTITMPVVKMDSEGAEKVNFKIKMKYDEIFKEVDECRDGGYSPLINMINYDHSESRGILSLWIDSFYDGGNEKISVYNIDLNDGSELNSNRNVIEKLGLDKNKVKSDLMNAVTEYFHENYADLEKSEHEIIEEKLNESLSDDFISSAVYFVKDDHLWARITVAQVAGSYGSEKMVEVCEI